MQREFPIEMTELLMQWYKTHARDLPWRNTKDPYAIWVSEIMLQQTRVDTVIPYYQRFMEVLPTVAALSEASEEQLFKLWEGLGYYTRVRNMKKAAQVLMESFHGALPADYAELCKLPGIGEYTAGAIASEAFDIPVPAVDGNVLRVLSRILAHEGSITEPKTKRHFTDLLRAAYPEKEAGIFTQSLMELGAVVCIPNGSPKCELCPVSSVCRAYQKGEMERYPIKTAIKRRRVQQRTVFLLQSGELLAIQKRTEPGVLSGLWELPGAESALSEEDARSILEKRGVEITEFSKLPSVKHIFTHITWEMTCYRVRCANALPDFCWVTEKELEQQYMMPSAYAKILKRA